MTSRSTDWSDEAACSNPPYHFLRMATIPFMDSFLAQGIAAAAPRRRTARRNLWSRPTGARYTAVLRSSGVPRRRSRSPGRTAEPSHSGPKFEPLANRFYALGNGHGGLPESVRDRRPDALPVSQGGQQAISFRLEPAEIHGVVVPVHGQENRLRPETAEAAQGGAFVPAGHGVARGLAVLGFLVHFEQQIVHRILEREQADVGLETQLHPRPETFHQVLRLERGFLRPVEGHYLRPFQARHVQRRARVWPDKAGMLFDPRGKPRPQV